MVSCYRTCAAARLQTGHAAAKDMSSNFMVSCYRMCAAARLQTGHAAEDLWTDEALQCTPKEAQALKFTRLTISLGPRPAKGFQAQMPVGLRPGSDLPAGAFAAPLGAASPSPSAPSGAASGREARSLLFGRPRRLRAERACRQIGGIEA
jgi:hypothetical protein